MSPGIRLLLIRREKICSNAKLEMCMLLKQRLFQRYTKMYFTNTFKRKSKIPRKEDESLLKKKKKRTLIMRKKTSIHLHHGPQDLKLRTTCQQDSKNTVLQGCNVICRQGFTDRRFILRTLCSTLREMTNLVKK